MIKPVFTDDIPSLEAILSGIYNGLVIDVWLGYKSKIAPFCGSINEYSEGIGDGSGKS